MNRTLTLGLALVTVAGTLAAPAGARPAELLLPDASDTARPVQPHTDLRSPDARDAALRATRREQAPAPHTDLRSPDARDAALSRKVFVLPVSDGHRPAEADGFDWGDAALGSGAAAAVLLLLGGAGALTLLQGRGESRHAARI
jgi:hypothetical protein